MFKFNFNVEDADVDGDSGDESKSTFKNSISEPHSNDVSNITTDTKGIVWYKAEHVKPTKTLLSNIDIYELNAKELAVGSRELRHLIAGFVLEDIKIHDDVQSRDIKTSEESHSDLIAGVYEGGAKIWECTNDLLFYLAKNFEETFWQDKRVLDLGCGAGLLGIYALKNGAIVDFQDYNKDVLEQITLPNILLNSKEVSTDAEKIIELKTNTNCYSGDWSHFAELTESLDKYDVILTAETIYNIDNQLKLLQTLSKRLAKNGTVLLAAKSHYFGVGGGLEQFVNVVTKDNIFHSQYLWQTEANLKRGILELKFKINE